MALWALLGLALLSPWPFGSVHPLTVRIITVVALTISALVLSVHAVAGRSTLPAVSLWPLVGFLGVGALQLVPLPPDLHAVVAPGSYQLWHPTEPLAAGVLGSQARPVSVDPEATQRWLAFTLGLSALALLAVPALADRTWAVRTAVAVTIGGLIVAVYGILARAAYGHLLFGRLPTPTVSPFGPFVSKNHFAGYVEMAALFALGLGVGLAHRIRTGGSALGWVGHPRGSRVLLAYGAAVAMTLAVLVSLSRGGMVSLALGGVALIALRRVTSRRASWKGRRRAALLLGVSGLLALSFVLVAVSPRDVKHRVLQLISMSSDHSTSFRLDTWRDSLRVARASPILGHGMAAFADSFPRFKRGHGDLRIEHAENDYLETLVDGGVLGLGCALWSLAAFCRIAFGALQKQRDRLYRGLGLGAWAAMAAMLVHGGFDFNLRIPSNALLFALLAATVLGSAHPRGAGHPVQTWALSLALWACLFGLLRLPLERARPETLLIGVSNSPATASLALRLSRIETSLRAELDRRPGQAEAWLYLGWVRAALGQKEHGAALASYAARLDPERQSLAAATKQLAGTSSTPK